MRASARRHTSARDRAHGPHADGVGLRIGRARRARRRRGQTAQAQDAQARAAQAKAEQARAAAELAFTKAATAAIAHGKRSDAEALARGRGAGDPAAAAILGRLAIDRGQYEDALALLQPAAARSPLGEAALELGCCTASSAGRATRLAC